MGDNKNPRKRTATNKTPYPTSDNGEELTITETPASLDIQMYDIFGTPAESTSSDPPASPLIATPSLCAASPPMTPTEEEMDAALRSLQPVGAVTPMNRVPESYGLKSLYWHGVLIGIAIGSRVAWDNKELFSVFR